MGIESFGASGKGPDLFKHFGLTTADVKAQLDAGAEWDDLAVEHSDHPTGDTGGQLGWITEDDTTFAEFLEAAGDAAPGSGAALTLSAGF